LRSGRLTDSIARDYADRRTTIVATRTSASGASTASTYLAINGSNERLSPRLDVSFLPKADYAYLLTFGSAV
jgi:hypothetical protein